ncbi:MAG: hypothetical protein IT158_08290 [Bryobacterales bacterium]|nr:hypothetical protein [Bryobacterales bacterium]
MRIVRFLLVLCLPLVCSAQSKTREQEIQEARAARVGVVEPDRRDRVEEILDRVEDTYIIERLAGLIPGFRPRLGGMISGSGIAAGPEYIRREIAGAADFRAAAIGSVRKYYQFETQLSMPRLAGGRVFLDLLAMHRNYASVPYYGPGPNSARTGRSNYRLEDTAYDFLLGAQPSGRLRLGVTGGYLQVNVGPGADRRFVSTDRIYGPAAAPGIDRQSDFLRGGPFVQYDYRDNPGGPRTGGNYLARFFYYSDRKLDRHSFKEIDLDAQQYIPFFNRRRVIALRAKNVFTDAGGGQVVPFYLQPTLGGSDDLRGFRSFRYHGNNLMVYTAEYRWEVFSGLDMALFADAGKVFNRWEDWSLSGLEESWGFGFRFNTRNTVFLRFDFGFSREGFNIWAKFGNVF